MKRVLIFMLCLVVFCFPLSAYAEEITTTEATTNEVVEDTPVEDETPSDEEIDGDTTTEETPNDENAPAEDDSSNGDIPEDTSDAEDEPVEDNPTEDETEEDVPVDTPTDETTDTPSDETTDAPTDTPTDAPVDTPTDEPVDVPTDTPTDEPTDVPNDEPIVDTPIDETPVEEVKLTPSDLVAKWLEANADTISLIISIIGAALAIWKQYHDVRKDMGIINNNALTIANDSAIRIAEARDKLVSVSESVTGYNERISELLGAFSTLLNENKGLKAEIIELKNYLHTATDANIEFSNEFAELLAHANIPNYKKDEMGVRHLEAVRAILDAEARANVVMADTNAVEETVEEVKENDSEEA